MENQYTFWTLCDKYDKIEIPIIQRNYAQGRETMDAVRIRKSFVNEYLLDALLKGTPRELDFVYGSVLSDKEDNAGTNLFIPLDGQQRLTTLFLLHWFIALKEGRMPEARTVLAKFSYETRPSTHDFCSQLIKKEKTESLRNIRQEILDSEWYDDEWNNDPTIKGMVMMIDTFAKNESLLNHPVGLFDALTNAEYPLISFYFIPLERFGLTENLYIRMNARGKELTPFEHFKSEFYNIISYHHELLEEVKDKIEYKWVENLWNYKEKDCFIIDKPFMRYLGFLSQMLYFKDATFRADLYESDFLDFHLLGTIYTNEDNLKFLIFALDHVELLQGKGYHQHDLLWVANTSIKHIFKLILDGPDDILRSIILFATLRYFYLQKSLANFPDFIRVVRNLLENTDDKSKREWPKLLKSIDNLIKDENVYDILLQTKTSDLLDGFYVPQRREENLKARIMKTYPEAKLLFEDAEDNWYFKGNITMLIASNFVTSKSDLDQFDLLNTNGVSFDAKKFLDVYNSYKVISERDFNLIWGDLLTTSFYTQYPWSRLIHDNKYSKNSAVMAMAMDHAKWTGTAELEDFLRDRERKFIKKLVQKVDNLADVRDVKAQLYLYYILHRRIMKHGLDTFFRNDFNFGWLPKAEGYSSIFEKGIANDQWYESTNPIFQTYKSAFRHTMGLKAEHALPPELIGAGMKRNPFELLIEWASD
jgi:Protein of unknown function DUF262